MTERIHIVVSRAEKARFRRHAARAGKSLSEWLRDSARAQIAEARAEQALDTPASLRDFFAACDRRERGREPDWEQHRQVIERSAASGAAPP